MLVMHSSSNRPRVILCSAAGLAVMVIFTVSLSSCKEKPAEGALAGANVSGTLGPNSRTASPVPPVVPNVAADLDLKQARSANSAFAFSREPIEAALPIFYSGMNARTVSKDSSLACLTAAVYYEAAGEPLQGERAVAQVVLNRVRHPSFPNSVCGVVYQGAQRRTGCQFTFTCDGSLDRAPVPRLWQRAEQVAERALEGSVEPSVGMATHYHADWVFPYWAPTLKKIAKIGPHIFYTWPGSWGRRLAFNQQPVWLDQPGPDQALAALGAVAPLAPTQAAAPPPCRRSQPMLPQACLRPGRSWTKTPFPA